MSIAPSFEINNGVMPDLGQYDDIRRPDRRHLYVAKPPLTLFSGRLTLVHGLHTQIEAHEDGYAISNVTGGYEGTVRDPYDNTPGPIRSRYTRRPIKEPTNVFIAGEVTEVKNVAWEDLPNRLGSELPYKCGRVPYDYETHNRARKIAQSIFDQGFSGLCVVPYDPQRYSSGVVAIADPGVGSGFYDLGQLIR